MAHQILFHAVLLAVVLGEAVAELEVARTTEAKGTHLRGAQPESRRRLAELTDSVTKAQDSELAAGAVSSSEPVDDSASSSSLDLAEAFHVPVMVGDPLHIGSLYHGQGGRGFLDVTAGNCEDNAACVSASAVSDRDQGSGTWTVSLLGADLQSMMSKQALKSGDLVHLRSAYRGPEGQNYLDTRNIGCDDNLHCVSASSSPDRDAGSGTWEIVRAEGPGLIHYGDKVYIRNKYTGMAEGVSNAYLDVHQHGCEGNRHCVSGASTPNRDHRSSTWAFLPAFV